MFGYKDDNSVPVGVSCKGEGLYNLYCLGCTSSRSLEASMLLHDWVSLMLLMLIRKVTMKELAKRISFHGVMNFMPIGSFLF